MIQLVLRALFVTILSLALFACSKQDEPDLSILATGVHKFLEPQVTALGRRIGIDVQMTYRSSPEISQAIQKGKASRFDAVWPASSLWIILGDTQGLVRHSQSIMRSPLVVALNKPLARRLGWMGEDIDMLEILAAAESGQLRLAVTSPTRGSLGAAAYLSYLNALAGNPEVLNQVHLQGSQVQAQARRFLSTVHREPRGAATLMRTFLSPERQFDAIFNVEANVIQTNQRLTAQGRPPLYALYPVDGLTLADSPLAYIDRGDAGKEQAFLALQQALLEEESQQRILQRGRRPARMDVDLGAMDSSPFNPEWGIDPERPPSPMTWPGRDVIREALRLLVIQAPAPEAEVPSTIRLAVAAGAVTPAVSAVVLRKAYARLSLGVEIRAYPAELALRLADAGREDGDVQRIDGLGKQYANLIQLTPPINYLEATAFTAGRDIPIDGWNSLRPYRIGVKRGIKFVELNTEGMDRYIAGDVRGLFRMLRAGRVDVVPLTRLKGVYQLKRTPMSDISPVEPPIARFPLYHYIHRSHAELAPELEAEFRRMQETGELTAIRQRVVDQLMRRAEQGLPICEDYACFEPPLAGRGSVE